MDTCPRPGDRIKVEYEGFVGSILQTGSGSNWDVEVIVPEILGISTFVRHEHVTVIEDA